MPHSSIAPALRRIRHVRAALCVLLIAAVVLPLIFLGVVTRTTYGLALTNAEQLVQRAADVLHEHTLKVFETQELILDQAMTLISKLDHEPDYGDLSEALKRLIGGRAESTSIWLLDPVGEVRASNVTLTEHLNSSDRDYFQAHVNGEIGTYVGKGFIGKATGRSSFGLSRRLSRQDGSLGGVVSISISSDYFNDFFKRATPEGDDVALLVRSDGEQLARDPPNQNAAPLSPDDPLMRAIALADSGVLWRVSSADGKERLFAYRRVGSYPLFVSVAITTSAILQPWLVSFLLDVSITLLVALVLAGLTFFALRATYGEEVALIRLSTESAKREEIEARLRQWQKLEAVGQITASVAHDFANLLTPILGNLHLLNKQPDHHRSQSRIAGALAAAERGEKLVNSLLAFARQQPLTMEIIDVNAIADQMKDLLSEALGSVATLTFDLAPDVWPVKSDESGLELAVLNLVINSRDSITANGVVRLSTSNTALHGEHDGLAGDFVKIVVCDTGSGMSPEVRARAFEPLFTTKEPGKGTGLGLASIYGFSKRCGGTVIIDSEMGKGTTVTIYLPRAESTIKAPELQPD
jgi:signal transduction histidine kinase